MADPMGALRPATVLAAWEEGQTQTAVERALTLLGRALPAERRDEISDLSIGRRDALLLELRARSFGPVAPCVVRCPACEETLEFALELRDLLVAAPDEVRGVVAFGGRRVHVRAATSRDLLATRDADDPVQALMQRCAALEAGEGEGEGEGVGAVPAAAAEIVAAEMARLDPQADLRFGLSCPACDAAWTSIFDVVGYLWREIDVEARRLLVEIDALARTYGWSEQAILELSSARRRAYLRLVGGA